MSSSPSPSSRYSTVAIAFHWLLALALIGVFCVGLYMTGLSFSPAKLKLFNWHKWAGVTILFLTVLRLLWRLTHRPPPLPETIANSMPTWQRMAHHGTHYLLYVLFFAVPLIGWAYSSAAGFPVVLFGAWPLPDLLSVDKAFAEAIKPWHRLAAFTLAGLVLLHVAAALKHHLMDRDGLLARIGLGKAS
ncbi:cytochrome b [Ottowia thiooxydans]|uniref:cytochrome b n=1 Tax=Ottowia thiooxydans TaxID=219182 RepID=UPI00339B1D8A